MFEDLRAAFREALDNFNKELRRENVSETADRLLVGMKNEIADEKVQIRDLEAQHEKALAGARREREAGATARRREKMARDIGDEETADVAAEHATRHESHHALLEKKAAAIAEEIEFRRGNVDEMIEKFSEARQKRDALSATAGRAGARRSFAEADDLFGELDRMAEKIEGERRQGEAAEALGDLDLDDLEVDEGSEFQVRLDESPPEREALDVDAALAELKRRMGKG